MRHDVYATELGQHGAQQNVMLSDALDESNIYIIAKIRDELAGFISVTPPTIGRYSIEKYLRREELSIQLDERTFEIRILTVSRAHRRSRVAACLMYAAFRWVEAGGEQIIAMGRSASVHGRDRGVSGAATFELIKTSVSQLRRMDSISGEQMASATGRRIPNYWRYVYAEHWRASFLVHRVVPRAAATL